MVEVWFFYVVLSVIIWGLNVIVDKIALTKHLSAYSYGLVYTPAKFAALLLILIFVPINFGSIYFLLTFIAAILATAGYFTYAYAMKREEASRIYSLGSLYPAVVAVLAAIFLSEIFQVKSYLGIILMTFGAILISYTRNSIRKTIPIIIIAAAIATNFFYAVEQVMSKMSLGSFTIWQFMGSYLMGNVFASVVPFVIPKFRKTMISEVKKLKIGMMSLIQISSSFWILAVVLFFYAASIGPLTLVSALSITAPLVVLLTTFLVSKFWPRVLREQIDRETLGLKLLAVALIFLGTYLIVV